MDEVYRCTGVFGHRMVQIEKEEPAKIECHAKLTETVLVGDYLKCKEIGNQLYATEIVKRTNVIKRINFSGNQLLAANVDVIFIVTSVNNDFNISRLERYYIIARESGARICFTLSKCDLTEHYMEYQKLLKKNFHDADVVNTSVYDSEFDCTVLYEFWNHDETAIFIGSSGVGKSSLLNILLENYIIKVQGIRKKDDRGRHTTTSRQLYNLKDNRCIIDTPGLRSIGISASNSNIETVFSDIAELEKNCRFSDCSHSNEPGCVVLHAIESGALDEERVERYLKLKGKDGLRHKLKYGKPHQRQSAVKQLKKRK
ncbi:MAG: ribosome small subunit-dependent GTPase A [Clostridia bacterium]|nr:ribosome small subunit-dependent GTPase A [Clostridia bacterium]